MTNAVSVPGGCPVHRFDPFEHHGMYAALAEARDGRPVFFDPTVPAWVVTRYADVLSVFRDPERFSARVALSPVAVSPDLVGPILRAGRYNPPPSNADLDPPEHTRIRRVVAPLLGPRRMERLEPVIRAIVAEALDRLPAAGRLELVSGLTHELPVRVLFALLDLPSSDIPRIKAWAEHFLDFVFGQATPEAQVAAAQGLVAWRDYCRALVARRLSEPGDDLVSDLVRAHQEDPASLSIAEIESYIQGLLVAGHETTTHQASNAVRLLLSEPGRWEALAADPTLIRPAVEECLRLDSSVVAWRRRAVVDTEVGGVTIPAGATVLLAMASANRDERQFPAPDDYRLDRSNGKSHLSFGHGIHFCIGASLARLEVTLLLEAMVVRFPRIRLVEQSVDYLRTISFRGPKALWVDVG